MVAAPPAVASPWGGACESKAPLAGASSLTMHQVCAVERMRSEAKTASDMTGVVTYHVQFNQ